MAWTKFFLFRKPLALYFTHWTLALMDSLVALVMRWRRYVMMFSNRRLSMRARRLFFHRLDRLVRRDCTSCCRIASTKRRPFAVNSR